MVQKTKKQQITQIAQMYFLWLEEWDDFTFLFVILLFEF